MKQAVIEIKEEVNTLLYEIQIPKKNSASMDHRGLLHIIISPIDLADRVNDVQDVHTHEQVRVPSH